MDRTNYNFRYNYSYSCDIQISKGGDGFDSSYYKAKLPQLKLLCNEEYKPLQYSDRPIIFPENVLKRYIIPFISKPKLSEECSLNLQSILLKSVRVKYLHMSSACYKIRAFKIEDQIVKSTRFIKLYSDFRTGMCGYLSSKEEEKAVKQGNENHELYKKYKLRDAEYIIKAPCDSFSGTLVKNTYYTCNILFQRDNLGYNVYCPCIQEIKQIQQETTYKYNDMPDNIIYTYAEPEENNCFLRGIKQIYK